MDFVKVGPSSDDGDVRPAQVLALIDASLAAGDFGHAFSGYLLLLRRDEGPGCKALIPEADFTAVLHKWAEQQERGGKKEEALWCYEAARSLWPENAGVHNGMGAFLHRLGRVDEAVACFRRALEINPDCASAQKNLTNAVSSPFGGWHFRMLNDKRRNSGYQTAIAKAIAQGHDTVLDIGSGTGLLSMFAANAGAKSIHACEESRDMVDLSRDILAANQMQDRIQLLHKLSTDMSVPEDLPTRVSLVVTEIFDAGLLGEGVVGTLQHAWNHLLLPPKTSESQEAGSYGRVVPARAVVYAQVIQCQYIRKQYRLLNDKVCNLDLGCLQGTSSGTPDSRRFPTDYQGEPYTSERIYEVPFGYQPLTPALQVLEIDFNNPQIVTAEHPTTNWKTVDFHAVADGQVDAVISWFDLCLDEDVVLSSSPTAGSCWEQAVFPMGLAEGTSVGLEADHKAGLFVKKQDTLTVAASCHGDCLHLKCTEITRHASAKMDSSSSRVTDSSHDVAMETVITSFKEKFTTNGSCDDWSRNSSKSLGKESTTAVVTDNIIAPPLWTIMNPDTIAILNDEKLNTALYRAVTTLIPNTGASENMDCEIPLSRQQPHPASQTETTNSSKGRPKFSIADISASLPITGLFAAKISSATRVCVTTSQSETRTLIQAIARTNGIEGCVDFEAEPHPLSPSSEATWDVLVTDLVTPSGILRERVLEDIAVGRVCALKTTGRVIPSTVSVFAMCIECASLQGDSEVLGADATNGLKVAKFFNQHKVSTFLDLHLSTRVYKQLSQPFLAFHLDLNEELRPDSADLPSFVSQVVTREVEALDDGRITAVPFWYDIGVDAANHVNTLENETHWRQAAFLLREGMAVRKGERVRVTGTIEESSFGFDVEVLR